MPWALSTSCLILICIPTAETSWKMSKTAYDSLWFTRTYTIGSVYTVASASPKMGQISITFLRYGFISFGWGCD